MTTSKRKPAASKPPTRRSATRKTTAAARVMPAAKAVGDTAAESATTPRDFPVVGIGASAGGLAAIEEFLAAMPAGDSLGMAQPDLVVEADAALLEVVLVNLLGNAWKFTSRRETARIVVGARVEADERVFFVKDDGAGFDQGTADHLFAAFQRFHTPEEFPGDGIGLATVKRLVARHGGRVWAESEVGKGATFFFTLPAK
jgi:signal transduction histidine kinase